MTPCSARKRVTIEAGMPDFANLPDTSRPGVMTVALMGSRIVNPGARSPKPCHFSLARSSQSSRLPMPSGARRSGPQTLNHQSFPHSSSTLRIARRKSSASMIDSSTSAVPPGGSIIAAETSHDAMIAYCGDVDVCIRYASLKMWRSSFLVCDSCTMICDACEMQRLDAAVQRVLQHLHVIGDAVIGALRERQDPRL